MTQDNLDITWQNFSGHVTNIISELVENEKFTDVTLVSDDFTEFKAHNPEDKFIHLQGIKSTGLRLILDFMYFGKISISKDEFYEFLSDTEFLKVNGINLFGGINCGKGKS